MIETPHIEEIDTEGYERVIHGTDYKTGLDCYIAIHDTTLGPALGGLRMWQYKNDQDALTDVLRLAEGMTLKNSLAELDLGGGKSVLNLPDGGKSDDILLGVAAMLNYLDGKYLIAEDVGCTVDDIEFIGKSSEHVSSIKGCGDPSKATAYGVIRGWQACAQFIRIQGRDQNWPAPENKNFRDLKDVSVTIQGIGNVGFTLALMAHELGMCVTVTDLNKSQYTTLAKRIPDLKWIEPDDVFDRQDLIFAPCALGSVINVYTIELIRSEVICGSANNQLEHSHTGYALMAKGKVYAPDYIVNAGGATNVFREFGHTDNDFEIAIKLDAILDRTYFCLETARQNNIPTNLMADKMAMVRIQTAKNNEIRATLFSENAENWTPEQEKHGIA